MAAAFAPVAARIVADAGGCGEGVLGCSDRGECGGRDDCGCDEASRQLELATLPPSDIGLPAMNVDPVRRDCARVAPPASSRATAVLIPVPLHHTRLRQRGYDQALELARPLSRRLDLPLRANGLHRARDTPPQSRLDATQRRRNLRDAFAWNATAPPPMHAILIDDVMTTGATLHAAAQALRRAGAQRVDAWVCARTL
ncbi:ComF family protein [Lysobacter sp. K5869]|nr:ComF family protein [Lysobacter sp. K5869]